jgi:hypothetical protein
MLRATALARLRLNCQPTTDPVLSDGELDIILDMYAIEDALGLAPTDAGWVGTWDIGGASRKAWLTKAAKVVPDVDYDVDGAKYTQSQMYANCLRQADRFADAGTASIIGLGS